MLFVAGEEHNSRTAKNNLARICRAIGDRCEVQLVDVMQDFESALKYNILLTPSLLVVEPPPQVVIVGNLNDPAEVRAALGIVN
jgi:hypothetical protein